MDKEDYRDVLSHFVNEEYLDIIGDESWEYVGEYCDKGGSPEVCVGLGLSQTEKCEWSFEKIAKELDTSRRSIYNARKELGLV